MPTCPACGNDTFTLQVNHPVIHKQQDTRPDGVIVFSAATAQIVWDAPGETIIHCSRCDEMQPGQTFVYQEDDQDGDALPYVSSLPGLRGVDMLADPIDSVKHACRAAIRKQGDDLQSLYAAAMLRNALELIEQAAEPVNGKAAR